MRDVAAKAIAKAMKNGRGETLFDKIDLACVTANNAEIVIALLCVAIKRLNFKSLKILVKALSLIAKEIWKS